MWDSVPLSSRWNAKVEFVRKVLGVDDKTRIEKNGNKLKLADLQGTDKALISYEPNAYTPALAIKVTGVGKIRKVGGDD